MNRRDGGNGNCAGFSYLAGGMAVINSITLTATPNIMHSTSIERGIQCSCAHVLTLNVYVITRCKIQLTASRIKYESYLNQKITYIIRTYIIIIPIRNQLFGANVNYNRGRLQLSYNQVRFVL